MKKFRAGGFLYNPNTNSVLLHQRDGNTTFNPRYWAFFGGCNEGDETAEQCFIRELYEEIGYTITEDQVVYLDDYQNIELGTHRHIFYVISDIEKSKLVLGEGADMEWIPLEKVFTYKLTDKTIDDLKKFIEKIDALEKKQ